MKYACNKWACCCLFSLAVTFHILGHIWSHLFFHGFLGRSFASLFPETVALTVQWDIVERESNDETTSIWRGLFFPCCHGCEWTILRQKQFQTTTFYNELLPSFPLQITSSFAVHFLLQYTGNVPQVWSHRQRGRPQKECLANGKSERRFMVVITLLKKLKVIATGRVKSIS